MDMQKPLKFDGQCFAVETQSDFYQFSQNLFFQDKPPGIENFDHLHHQQFTINKIVEKIKSTYNIALMPFADLFTIAQQKLQLQEINEQTLRIALRKKKLIQKRRNAKSRKRSSLKQKQQQIGPNIKISTYDQIDDIKKQKNRLSAQISRDKKKQYYLKLQFDHLNMQKQLTQLKWKNSQLQVKIANLSHLYHQNTQSNSINKLLILLGVIFLVNLIKNFTNLPHLPQQTYQHPLSQLNLNINQQNFVKNQLNSLGIQFLNQYNQNIFQEIYVNKQIFDKIQQAKSDIN